MTLIHGTADPGWESVRDAFEMNFTDGRETGAAVAVYRNGRPVVDLWAGIADPETGQPWRRDTAQVVYSSTKTAVAACAHLLVADGLLDVDAPVAAYRPQFGAAGKQHIPVRWLLSHQAGLPALDEPATLAELAAWEPVVERLAAQKPVWTPGAKHGYHAFTFGWLVGELIRRTTGELPGEFFARRVAEPLGLDYWMGLPDNVGSRVSRVVPPEPVDVTALEPELRQAIAELTDPSTLMMRAMAATVEPLDLNDPATRRIDIPAVNGICTARSLARLYAGLIGEVDGVRLLDTETLAAAITEQAHGIDAVLGSPTRPAVGFGLPPKDSPWWTKTAFGFGGYGGSLGFADPATGVAFGYVMNRLTDGIGADPRAANLARAVQSVR